MTECELRKWTFSWSPTCYEPPTTAVSCCGYVYMFKQHSWTPTGKSQALLLPPSVYTVPEHAPLQSSRPLGTTSQLFPPRDAALPRPQEERPQPAPLQPLHHHLLLRPLRSSPSGTASAARRAFVALSRRARGGTAGLRLQGRSPQQRPRRAEGRPARARSCACAPPAERRRERGQLLERSEVGGQRNGVGE